MLLGVKYSCWRSLSSNSSRSLRLLDLFYSVGDRCVDYGEITKPWKRGAVDDFEMCEVISSCRGYLGISTPPQAPTEVS